MKIGIDISQLAYEKTGVASFLKSLVVEMIKQDKNNEYILFYSSMRKSLPSTDLWSNSSEGLKTNLDAYPNSSKKVTIKEFRFPPTLLDLLWNKLHVLPIEWFTGPVDIFISSDWTQPPSKAKKVTILYDLIVYKYPNETAAKIVNVQKKRLEWVKKEVDKILCISEATKKDAMDILKISEERLKVIYPGI